MSSSLLILLSLAASAEAPKASPKVGEIVSLAASTCSPGPVRGPSRTFELYVFCDDALGTHLGVVHVALVSPATAAAWSLDNRFWQNADWSADASAYAWVAPDVLLVTTSPVYGTGALYRLDLASRRVGRLWPRELESGNTSGVSVALKAVDITDRHVTLQAGSKTERVGF